MKRYAFLILLPLMLAACGDKPNAVPAAEDGSVAAGAD